MKHKIGYIARMSEWMDSVNRSAAWARALIFCINCNLQKCFHTARDVTKTIAYMNNIFICMLYWRFWRFSSGCISSKSSGDDDDGEMSIITPFSISYHIYKMMHKCTSWTVAPCGMPALFPVGILLWCFWLCFYTYMQESAIFIIIIIIVIMII